MPDRAASTDAGSLGARAPRSSSLAPAIPRAERSITDLSETARHAPSRSPPQNHRLGAGGPDRKTAIARTQRAAHRTSVRYSTDLKKKVGLSPQRNAAHHPARVPKMRRPRRYEPQRVAAEIGISARRMNTRIRGFSPIRATRGALRT